MCPVHRDSEMEVSHSALVFPVSNSSADTSLLATAAELLFPYSSLSQCPVPVLCPVAAGLTAAGCWNVHGLVVLNVFVVIYTLDPVWVYAAWIV